MSSGPACRWARKSEPARFSNSCASEARRRQAILRKNHGGAVDCVVLHCLERLVGLCQRETGHLGLQLDFRGELEEVTRIGAGHVGDAANLALTPEQVVIVE